MKVIIVILFIFACEPVRAQECESGILDERVAETLRTVLPDLKALPANASIEQIREVKIEARSSVPARDVESIKVTSDSIAVRVYNPHHQSNLPIIISYHPGGFVTPILPFMEYDFWRQAKTYGAIVVAVDYRVAPEHRFPTAVQDAYGAFKWVLSNGHRFGGDTSRIMLLGASAGGNLAAVVCHKAKQDGLAGRIRLQVLNCPSTDNPLNHSKYPSYESYAAGYFITREFCLYYIGLYAPGVPLDNVEVAPIQNHDYSDLPPALVITAEFDPLRDEGREYALRLAAAGVPVQLKCFAGQIHCLVGLPPDAEELTEVDTLILTAMKTHLR